MGNKFENMHPNFKNEIGNRYGTLVVVEYAGRSKRCAVWKCLCDCGEFHEAKGNDLRQGKCTRCKECRRIHMISVKSVHGCSISNTFMGTGAYKSWLAMNTRCSNKNSKRYNDYGGRGVVVCERWSESDGIGFRNFLEDMGERPDGMTLDRIDVNGNYEPSNCRWATLKEQANNKRTSLLFQCKGKDLSIKEIASLLKFKIHICLSQISYTKTKCRRV